MSPRHGLLCALALLIASQHAVAQTPGGAAMENSGTGSSPGASTGQIVGLAIPSAFVLYGLVSLKSGTLRDLDYDTRREILSHDALLKGTADNYVQFAPAAAAYVLKFTGVQSKSSLLDMTLMYGFSNAIASGVVWGGKYLAHRERPDGSNTFSFPSGHATTAFVAAEFLHQEYGDKSIWVDVGGYGAATLVAASRVLKNRHWVSDVVGGAGLGILCTKAVYYVYPRLKQKILAHYKKTDLQAAPLVDADGGGGLMVSVTF